MANPWNPFEQAVASSRNIKKASEAVGPVKKPLEAANDIYGPLGNQSWNEAHGITDSMFADAEQKMNNSISSAPSWSLANLSKNINPSRDEMAENFQAISENTDRPGWMSIPEVVDAVSNDLTNKANNSNVSGVEHNTNDPIIDMSRFGEYTTPQDLMNMKEESDQRQTLNALQDTFYDVFGGSNQGSYDETYRADPYSITAEDLMNGPIPQGSEESKKQMGSLIYMPTDPEKEGQKIYENMYGDKMIRHDVYDTYRADPYAVTADELMNGPIPQGNQTTKEDILRHYGIDEDFLGPISSDDLGQSNIWSDITESTIDDGNLKEDNLKSLYMTGSQYKKYVEAGLGGRPIDEIDDNAVYNKIHERGEYGFIPYSPDVGSALFMTGDNLVGSIGDAFTDLGNIRSNLDYGIDYNGKYISGKDFDETLKDYNNQVIREAEDWQKAIRNGENVESIYTVTLDDGSEYRIKDNDYFFIDDDGNIDRIPEDGRILLYFPNANEIIEFNNEYDYKENFSMYAPISDMTLSDGTTLPFDEVTAISNGEGDRDYGPLNIAKPAAEIDDFITDNGFNFEDLVPKMFDMTMQSAPYFSQYTSFPLAFSNMYRAARGIDPQSKTADGTYSMLSDELTDELILGSTLGNTLMPLTEIGFGNIGGKLMTKPLRGLTGSIGERAWMPAANYGIGILGEGAEEIPGNMMEGLGSSGFRGWYANPVYETDENGNQLLDEEGNPIPLYDAAGKPVVDKNTSLGDRWRNFWADAPEAFIGGSLLGLGFGLRPSEVSSTYRDTKRLIDENKRAKASGTGVYIPAGLENLYTPMTEKELYGNK